MIGEGQQSLRARIYRPVAPRAPAVLVLHMHGGVFVDGSVDSGEAIAKALAGAGALVVSIDYPRAPKCPFPQPLEAASGALKWLYKTRAKWGGKKSRIFVAGEEAGGNLAAALALVARDQQVPPLAGQILLSPMLDPRLATCSMREADAGPVGCKWADGWHEYLCTADKAAHPYAAPATASRLAGVAPALILTAEDDLLRDESLAYGRRLRAAGVKVQEHILPTPTGWPCALSQPESFDKPWIAAVRDQFTRFFDDTLNLPISTAATTTA